MAIKYLNNEPGASGTVAAAEKTGGIAWAIRAFVSRSDSCRALVDVVERKFGPIEILVNRAGSLIERQRLAELKEECWDQVQNVNLKSAYL